jgi:hypothetical protein
MIHRCSFAATLLFALPVSAAESDPVVAAARLRDKLANTLILEYRQTSRVTLTATPTRPKSEVSTSADNRIVLDGSKVRVEDNNPAMSTGQGFSRQSRIEVFDGIDSRTLFPIGIGTDSTPSAIRHEKSSKAEPGLPEVIFLHFRGLDPVFRHTLLVELKSTGRSEVVDGAKCLEYELRKMDSVRRYWLDPSSDFIVRRIQSGQVGRVDRRTAITYRNDPGAGWVPTGWRSADFNDDGSPKYVRECEITRLVLNDPIDPSEFRLQFKPGTHLHDQEAKKELLILDDGSAREFTAAERFGTPPRTSIWQWIAINGWTIVLIASVLLLCLVALLYRRRSRRIEPKWDDHLGDAE